MADSTEQQSVPQATNGPETLDLLSTLKVATSNLLAKAAGENIADLATAVDKATSAVRLAIDVESANSEKAKLEVAKLKADVAAARKGRRATFWTAVVTISIAAGGWYIQSRTAADAQANETHVHQDEVYSGLLSALSSSSSTLRESATVELAKYADPGPLQRPETIQVLVDRLDDEDNPSALSVLIREVRDLGAPAFDDTVMANRRASLRFVHSYAKYLGEKTAASPGKSIALAQLDVDHDLRAYIGIEVIPPESGRLNFAKAFTATDIVATSTLNIAFSDDFGVAAKRVSDSALLKDKNTAMIDARGLMATSLALEGLIHDLSGRLAGKDIAETALIGVDFRSLNFDMADFDNSYISGQADGASFQGSNLCAADLADLSVDSANFTGATLTNGTVFDDVYHNQRATLPIFAGADWWDAKTYSPSARGYLTPDWLQDFYPRAAQESLRSQLISGGRISTVTRLPYCEPTSS